MNDAQAQCPNFALNEQQCPCTNTVCTAWALCCWCAGSHIGHAEEPLTPCMRVPRPEDTLGLPKDHPGECPNLAVNLERCPCRSATCSRKGTCCDCIRHHWTADGMGRTACMR